MITSIEYVQLKAFARQDGALLALLWVFTSVLYIIGMTNQMIGLAATMLIIYTPFFVGGVAGCATSVTMVARDSSRSVGAMPIPSLCSSMPGCCLLSRCTSI